MKLRRMGASGSSDLRAGEALSRRRMVPQPLERPQTLHHPDFRIELDRLLVQPDRAGDVVADVGQLAEGAECAGARRGGQGIFGAADRPLEGLARPLEVVLATPRIPELIPLARRQVPGHTRQRVRKSGIVVCLVPTMAYRNGSAGGRMCVLNHSTMRRFGSMRLPPRAKLRL